MKRTLVLALTLFLGSWLALSAMSYEEARRQAWFLTDKMAYELNLTPEQYDRAYEINLDYLMSLRSPSDYMGDWWYYRDADLRCVLYDWQYNLYRTLDYFFRPVIWRRSRWYYPIAARYHYGYYYYHRPPVYVSYRGGRWRGRRPGTPSPYIGLRPAVGSGMRDRYPDNSRPRRPGYGSQQRPGSRPEMSGGRPQAPNDRPGAGGRPERRPDAANPPSNRWGGTGRPSGNRGSYRPEGGRGVSGSFGSSRPQSGGRTQPAETVRAQRPSRNMGTGGSSSTRGRNGAAVSNTSPSRSGASGVSRSRSFGR